MTKKTVLLTTLVGVLVAASACAADPAPAAMPTIAKPCMVCHKAEAGALRGYYDGAAFKSKTIQMKIDESVELVKFDEDEIKVVSGEGKTGDGELLRKIKKGHEIKIEFVELNGVKNAVKVFEKPPVKISDDMLSTTADVEKLVALGPEKGKYFLFDSRPVPRFQQGYIPTAVSFPFSAFDKMAEKLMPKDKNALVVFYCQGVTCNLSPSSAGKAQKLGYTNVNVYKDGMPAWQERNHGVLTAQFFNDAWIAKGIPVVLLDARSQKAAAKGFIKGAVTFPATQAARLAKKMDIKKTAPVIVYDQADGKDAAAVAKNLIKSGFKNVLVLSGGFDAWQAAKYDVVTGKLSAKATYVPKPLPGEINLDEFKKYVEQLPANVMIIDVRNADEVANGMFKTAKLIPSEEIKDRVAEIPKDKLIITQCSTGVRAEMVYNALKNLGYTNVKFVNAKTEFNKDGSYKITKD